MSRVCCTEFQTVCVKICMQMMSTHLVVVSFVAFGLLFFYPSVTEPIQSDKLFSTTPISPLRILPLPSEPRGVPPVAMSKLEAKLKAQAEEAEKAQAAEAEQMVGR